MSSISNWLWGTSQLDDAVDKATSEFLPVGAEDIALNLEICDQIRSKSVPAKDAMRALKRRLNYKNPNVQILALGLTDICIKNGGDHFLNEVASRDFMDNLVSILKIPILNVDVKNSILRHVQNWAIAFEGKPSLSYVCQVYRSLQSEGFTFPPRDTTSTSSAMVSTMTAPEWVDSEVCLRCRTSFSFTNRKHHCRNCGLVFDQQCSSKAMPLPHFGITQEVRVCDGCWNKVMKKGERPSKHRNSVSHSPTTARHRSSRSLADAELQRAIQLSLEEVGANGRSRSGYVPFQHSHYSEPPLIDRTTHPRPPAVQEDDDDPDLKAAIEASLREANAPRPSAPIAVETPQSEQHSFSYVSSRNQPASIPSYDLGPLEEDAILTFSQTVENVHAQGGSGRDMSRYPAVGELYDKANGLRPKLVASLDDAGRKEEMLSEMHDKLSQIVKLYDKALTEHVSHQAWRARSPQQTHPPHQPQHQTTYMAAHGWSSQAPPQPSIGTPQAESSYAATGQTYMQKPVEQPQQKPQWHSPQQQLEQPMYAPPDPQYNQPKVQHSPIHPQQQRVEREPEGHSHQQQVEQQPSYTLSGPQYQQPAQHSSSHPHVAPPQQFQYADPTPVPPTPVPVQPSSQALYTQPPTSPSAAAYRMPSAPSQYQQPQVSPSHSLHWTDPPTQQQSPQQPTFQPSTPKPPTVIKSHGPGLSRHSTISSPPSSTANGLLGRHNTVSHTPSHYQQQRPQRQQPMLPSFPAAPTSAPQAFQVYMPSVPNGIVGTEQGERKEALLIDL